MTAPPTLADVRKAWGDPHIETIHHPRRRQWSITYPLGMTGHGPVFDAVIAFGWYDTELEALTAAYQTAQRHAR